MGIKSKINAAFKTTRVLGSKALKSAALSAGLEVHRIPTENNRIYESIQFLHSANNGSDWSRCFLSCAVKYLSSSRSQLLQDLFALSVVGEKRNGYFVEFGGGDGVTFSNSYMLETTFGWRGIVAEPSAAFAPKIIANRRCAIDTRCVWSTSGEKLKFREVRERGELSSLSQFAKYGRDDSMEYTVETVSLNDLLEQHDAPTELDYLSIDTEGSELDILKSFDFRRWRFNVITVETDYLLGSRKAIYDLLTANGYIKITTELAQIDEWYVKTERIPIPGHLFGDRP
jgi:FkbM family methyltransferase